MRRLACPPHGDITYTNEGDRVGLPLQHALVEKEVSEAYPTAIQPREEMKQGIVCSLLHRAVLRFLGKTRL